MQALDCRNFRFRGPRPAPAGGESDISELYLKKLKEWRKLKDKRYHLPLEGSRVFIRVWQQMNGWENEVGMFRGSAVVRGKGGAGGAAGGKNRVPVEEQ